MDFREKLAELKKPQKAENDFLGTVYFRGLTVGEALLLETLEGAAYNAAFLQKIVVTSGGMPIWANEAEVMAEPVRVINALLKLHREINPLQKQDDAAGK